MLQPERTSETYWLGLTANSYSNHGTGQDSAARKRRKVSEARLEQRVNAQVPKSGPNGYFRVMLLSDKFSGKQISLQQIMLLLLIRQSCTLASNPLPATGMYRR